MLRGQGRTWASNPELEALRVSWYQLQTILQEKYFPPLFSEKCNIPDFSCPCLPWGSCLSQKNAP